MFRALDDKLAYVTYKHPSHPKQNTHTHTQTLDTDKHKPGKYTPEVIKEAYSIKPFHDYLESAYEVHPDIWQGRCQKRK